MKFTLGLLLGAAVGGIIVHYLDSVEGYALRRRISKDVNDLSDSFSEMADTVTEKAKSLIGKKEAMPEEERIMIVGITEEPLP
ncbi:YtxH domain-containing protein [Sediminibacterium soli]|uniref:YtxH domain-containing protein n=1 Tax=Sediminibacterium soli TaxID=2698829 RepID=UPI0013799C59|nr:YtxH domain-containing protein [Sediminibacterium soli]NCI45244.1 YtxH domain-containing protein [Sediminibacterium soli]